MYPSVLIYFPKFLVKFRFSQSSVLGLLLFIIFINDLTQILKYFFKLFDDVIAAITEEELRLNKSHKGTRSLTRNDVMIGLCA